MMEGIFHCLRQLAVGGRSATLYEGIQITIRAWGTTPMGMPLSPWDGMWGSIVLQQKLSHGIRVASTRQSMLGSTIGEELVDLCCLVEDRIGTQTNALRTVVWRSRIGQRHHDPSLPAER